MPLTLKKYLLIPRLAILSARVPENPQQAWDQYWADIKATGTDGDVLWDSGSDHEMLVHHDHFAPHLDPLLPILDVGCGNGSTTRWLAEHFSQAIGVDVSANAITRATKEAADHADLSFSVRDVTAPGAGKALRAQIGEANVFIRGVLHVLDEDARTALAENLYAITGQKGRIFLAETNFQGSALDYVHHLGATLQSIPKPLERAIRSLPMPGQFGPTECRSTFNPDAWQILDEGPTTIETVPLLNKNQPESIPGYFSILSTRPGQPNG